jgi:hypothetical protein
MVLNGLILVLQSAETGEAQAGQVHVLILDFSNIELVQLRDDTRDVKMRGSH